MTLRATPCGRSAVKAWATAARTQKKAEKKKKSPNGLARLAPWPDTAPPALAGAHITAALRRDGPSNLVRYIYLPRRSPYHEPRLGKDRAVV